MERLFDAHTHLGFIEGAYTAAVSVSNTADWPLALVLRAKGMIALSFGVHPWGADCEMPENMYELCAQADAVGEIGMDSVWCKVDMARQRAVFAAQLELAQNLRKPVVLHTKGCEPEIAEMISAYNLPFLVHWYSCETIYSSFLRKNILFSVGPDVAKNPAVQNVAKTIPLSRLMLETDGREGISWSLGLELNPEDVLRSIAQTIAGLRGISVDAVLDATYMNAAKFYNYQVTSGICD
ncbi:MAG: TatD family hydrolase [Clostridiales bacterium]|nr:TatD family hydrolase [Clostridiales bacterium]